MTTPMTLALAYAFGLTVAATAGATLWKTHPNIMESTRGARLLLVAPVWPLLLAWLFCRGVCLVWADSLWTIRKEGRA